ncbi:MULTISPECIES: hypothetical protein [unclassified Nocardiopsis]|uniref:hypothetical protein n=1 Tax=Nocardiopsis TaxID=2013 RepID=UPI00387A923E
MSTGEEQQTAPNAPAHGPYGGPPAERREPDSRVHRREPLFPHEVLEGWRHPDGEWHWRYRARVDARPITVRMTAEPGVPVEEMVERVRAVAVLGRGG